VTRRGAPAADPPGETGDRPPVPTRTAPTWHAVLASVLVSLGSSLPIYVLAAMSVEIDHSLAFGASALGLAAGAYYFGAAASSIPFSRLAERVGGARVMRVGSVAVGVLLILIATVARSWSVLTVLLGLAGVATGAIMPANYLFLARRVPRQSQGRAFGLNQAAVPLAALLGGLAVPSVALTVGWRWAFAMAGVVAVVAGAVVPLSMTSLAERRRARQGRVLGPVRLLPLVTLSVGVGLGMFAVSGFIAFLALGAVHGGFSRAGAGYLVATAGAAAVVMRVVVGFGADRRGGNYFRAVAVMMTAGGVGYLLISVASAERVRWLFAAAAIAGVGVGWGWNALFNLGIVRAHLQAPAKATGVTDVGGRIGGVLGPVATGQILDHAHYDVAWLVLAIAAFLAAMTVTVGYRQLATDTAGPRGIGTGLAEGEGGGGSLGERS